MPHKHFATIVNDLLDERDWSQRDLARAIAVDPAHVSRILGSTKRPVSAHLMQAVATALGIAPEQFPEYREWIVVEAIRHDPALREHVFAGLAHRPLAEAA